ncbi:hypothetical protein ACFE04_029929 [Oxalis oulophora]
MPSEILPITNPKSSKTTRDNHHHLFDDPSTSLLITSSPPSPYNETPSPIKHSSSLLRTLSYQQPSTSPQPPQPPPINNYQQQRRRRVASDSSLSSLSNNDSFSSSAHYSISVEDAVSETWLITRWTLKLLGYLGVGYRWITRLLALGCYAMLLMPGFIQVGYYYFFSKQVRRSIVYGNKRRNRLDLYLPVNSDGPKPVVAFITGGAWVIGYKAWGSLLGQHLSERDILVACIDYRNFPQGTIGDMVKDASQGIAFICNNIAEYGGDPDRIYLMGQSAGAHISACTIVDQAIKEAGEGDATTWNLSQIKAYFGLSGGYNLLELVDHFNNRGLYRSLFLSIMEGEESLVKYSPEVVVRDPNVRHAITRLPPVYLFHGTGDYSIPAEASKKFARTLQKHGVQAEPILYEGKTHTDLFLQDPMRGNTYEMFEDLLAIIHKGDEEALAKDAAARPHRRLVPECMLKLAGKSELYSLAMLFVILTFSNDLLQEHVIAQLESSLILHRTDIVDEAITFFRANVFFRNFDIKSQADKLLIYLTFYINVALKRLEGCRTLAVGTKAIINLGLEDVPVPGESAFPFPGLFPLPQSQEEAELFRNYLKQIREETSGRLLSVAYRANGTPNKWWLAFAKRKYMNIIAP